MMKRWGPLVVALATIAAFATVTQRVVATGLSASAEVMQRTGRMRLLATEVSREVLIQDEATQSMLLDPTQMLDVSEHKIDAYDRQKSLMRELVSLAQDEKLRKQIVEIEAVDESELKSLDELLLEHMAEGKVAEARAEYLHSYVPARAGYTRRIAELSREAEHQARAAERALAQRTSEINEVLMIVFGLLGVLVGGLVFVNRRRRQAVDTSNRMQILVSVTRHLLSTNSVATMLAALEADLGFTAAIEPQQAVAPSFAPGRIELPLLDGKCPVGTLVLHSSAVEVEAQGFWLNLSLTVSQHLTALRLMIERNQGQKLESVGRLASGIAHEINTPVQFVSDSVHFVSGAFNDLVPLLAAQKAVCVAAKEGPVSPDLLQVAADAEQSADLDYTLQNVPKALERSVDGLQRVATLVLSMKAFAHPDLKTKDEADLNKALGDTLIIASNEYKYVAEVECDLQPLPKLFCHINELNQVFLNIIVNSAHAIGDQVKGTERKGRIRIATRLDGDSVEVSIADTGGGIPDSIRDKIFDPFFTTKEVGKGTGQGLAIARSVVVEKHGGTLTFTSEPGLGTTFIIRLPVAPVAQDERQAEAA